MRGIEVEGRAIRHLRLLEAVAFNEKVAEVVMRDHVARMRLNRPAIAFCRVHQIPVLSKDVPEVVVRFGKCRIER